MKKKNLYPILEIPRITNPNRFYAIPLLGGLVKIIMLIPVFIFLFVLAIAFGVMNIINSFFVLLTGRYWKNAYEVNIFFIHMMLKTSYFFYGLSNRYPGFSSKTYDFQVTVPFPEKPNRWFAFPVLGGIARFILLFPYSFYTAVMQNAGNIGSLIASFPVFFTRYYPESLYEIERDSTRLTQAMTMYWTGLEDTYPSWWISMNHKTVKIILIILGVLSLLFRFQLNTQQQQYHSNPSSQYQSY